MVTRPYHLNLIRNLQHYGENKSTDLSENRIVVDYGSDHIFYESEEVIVNEFTNDDVYERKLMKQIFFQENFPSDIYIDDDDGNIMPIEVL